MITGECITAIAMTEPNTGSDLQALGTTARGEGDNCVFEGLLTYITNGQNADLVIVVAKTDKAAGAALSSERVPPEGSTCALA